MTIGNGDEHIRHVAAMSNALKKSGRDDTGISILGDLNLAHAERDFHIKMRRLLGDKLPDTYPLELTVKDGFGGTTKKTYHVLQPYETFSLLHKQPAQFLLAMLGGYDLEVVGKYWEAMSRSSWQSSPMLANPNLWQKRHKVFPTFWHSDGGEIYLNKTYSIYHFSTPFTYDVDPRDAKLYVLAIEESIMVHETEIEIASFIAYNDEVLRNGVHPALDHNKKQVTGKRKELIGQDIAGGFRACFSAWTGDIKEEVKVHRFSRFYQCNFFCKKCLGCKHLPEGNAFNFGPSAQWYQMLVSQR